MKILYYDEVKEDGNAYKKVVARIDDSVLSKCELDQDIKVVDEMDFTSDVGFTPRQQMILDYVDSFEPIRNLGIKDEDWQVVCRRDMADVLLDLDVWLQFQGLQAVICYGYDTAYLMPKTQSYNIKDMLTVQSYIMTELRDILNGHNPILWLKTHATDFIGLNAIEKANPSYKNITFTTIFSRDKVLTLAEIGMYHRRFSDIADAVYVCDRIGFDATSVCISALSDVMGVERPVSPVPSGCLPDRAMEKILKFMFDLDWGENKIVE